MEHHVPDGEHLLHANSGWRRDGAGADRKKEGNRASIWMRDTGGIGPHVVGQRKVFLVITADDGSNGGRHGSHARAAFRRMWKCHGQNVSAQCRAAWATGRWCSRYDKPLPIGYRAPPIVIESKGGTRASCPWAA